MALTAASKPSLSSVYTKYRIKNKVLCEPYSWKKLKGELLEMLIFTNEEKSDITNFMNSRQSYQDFKSELAVDEQQLLDSLDFGRKIW